MDRIPHAVGRFGAAQDLDEPEREIDRPAGGFSRQEGRIVDDGIGGIVVAELGAERLLDRVDADVEYQAAAAEWRARVVEALKARAPVAAPAQLATSGAAAVSKER